MFQLNFLKNICFVWLITLVICEGKKVIDYTSWQLIQINGFRSNQELSQFLSKIERNNKIRVIDVTKEALIIGASYDIDLSKLQDCTERSDLKWTILHKNIGKLIQSKQKRRRSIANADETLERYLPLDEMEKYFSSIVEAHPDKIKRDVVGKSFEGKNIYLFTISSNQNSSLCEYPNKNEGSIVESNILQELRKLPRQNRGRSIPLENNIFDQKQNRNKNGTHNILFFNFNLLKSRAKANRNNAMNKVMDSRKPVIFVDAGLHSREWVSPAAALYLMKKLVVSPHMTANVDWLIMPMVNPDGYVYSWEYDRFWRKTRSNSTLPECFGADMNRNFAHRWGEVDTGTDPCSEHYGGTNANSEIETQILINELLKEKKRIKAYVSLHNWGQEILYPYLHTATTFPSNNAQLKTVGDKMVNAIKEAQGAEYKCGHGSQLLYAASGTSIDWAYDVLGVPLSFLFELRDRQGLLGFLLPEIFIQPTGEDLLAAMSSLASEVEKEIKHNCYDNLKKL